MTERLSEQRLEYMSEDPFHVNPAHIKAAIAELLALRARFDALGEGILARQDVILTPMADGAHPAGMDAVDAALAAIDDLAKARDTGPVTSEQDLIDAVEYLVNSRLGGDADVGTIVAYLLEVMGSEQLRTDIRAALAKEQGRG